MKVEFIDNDSYKIFINSDYKKDLDLDNKEELGKFIKSVILKIRKFYNILLEGLYEVHVYVIKFIGTVLEIKNIDTYLSKNIDLKIVVHNDEEIYLKVFKYELIKDYKSIKYFNNFFYVNVNDMEEKEIYKLVENTSIIYGNDLEEIKSKWHCLTT